MNKEKNNERTKWKTKSKQNAKKQIEEEKGCRVAMEM